MQIFYLSTNILQSLVKSAPVIDELMNVHNVFIYLLLQWCIMCHSLGRNRLEKLYMGNGSYYIVYHITDYRNEIRDNDFNRSLYCICMDRDNDTENDKEVEKNY